MMRTNTHSSTTFVVLARRQTYLTQHSVQGDHTHSLYIANPPPVDVQIVHLQFSQWSEQVHGRAFIFATYKLSIELLISFQRDSSCFPIGW